MIVLNGEGAEMSETNNNALDLMYIMASGEDGQVELEIRGDDAPRRLTRGDEALIPAGREYSLRRELRPRRGQSCQADRGRAARKHVRGRAFRPAHPVSCIVVAICLGGHEDWHAVAACV
ncbi:unnamed protein product [Prorocentrum cordatum]|uniref:Uncharacterized protein n=1 Tax=Prorocentrum cordatum TaxID=2364126 RepID=A0ABN9SAY0_9DINO|nr:unnamed protein product [Polarella glacialis]